MTRPLSLAALTVMELTPPEMISCAAEAGFSHVGLRLIPATEAEPRYPVVGDTAMVRETRQRLDDCGVSVLDVEIFRIKPDCCVADYEPALETAARLGASEILVAGDDPDEGRLAEHFAQLCDAAAEFNLHPSLEFMPWTDVKNLTQAGRIVNAVGRPNAGLLIDAFHLDRSRSRVEDVREIPREWLRFAQLCDVPAIRPSTMDEVLIEARAERRFPGEGGLDLIALLRALPAELPLSIEVPTRQLARTVGATERARRALTGTRALLAAVDDTRFRSG
jgi:sugar phosphate isomerase/epimerase